MHLLIQVALPRHVEQRVSRQACARWLTCAQTGMRLCVPPRNFELSNGLRDPDDNVRRTTDHAQLFQTDDD
jgi:hypothetical protein